MYAKTIKVKVIFTFICHLIMREYYHCFRIIIDRIVTFDVLCIICI